MKIIHLACRHFLSSKGPTELRNEDEKRFEETVKSQFLVAKYINEHPDIPVLQEGAAQDFIPSTSNAVDFLTRSFFPNGLPHSYAELTLDQKEHLYMIGGARIMLGLEVIPTLYKSIHPDVGHIFDKKVATKLAKGKKYSEIDYVGIKREREALECAKEAALLHYGNLEKAIVILPFGKSHHFQAACDELGIEHARLETNQENLQSTRITRDIPTMKIGKYKIQLIPDKDFNTLRLLKNEKEMASTRVSPAFTQELTKHNNIKLVIQLLRNENPETYKIARKLEKEKSGPRTSGHGIFDNTSKEKTITQARHKTPKSKK